MFTRRGWIQGLIGVLVTGLWLVMMASLLLKEGVLFAPKIEAITYRSVFEGRFPFGEDWMGIYLQDRKVGYISSIISPYQSEGITGLLIRHLAHLSVSARQDYQFDIQGYSLIGPDYLLREFFFNLTSPLIRANLSGARDGENLHLKIRLDGTELREILPISKTGISPLSPIFNLPSLKEGKVYAFEIFDPIKKESYQLQMRIKGRERIVFKKALIEATLAEILYGKIPINLWLDRRGQILKLASAGWMLLREDEEEARRGVP